MQQPRIFHRNDRLIGKACGHLDLLVGEWANRGAADREGADKFAVLEHRYGERGAHAGAFDDDHCRRIALDIGLVG